MDKKKKWLKITLGIMALVIVGGVYRRDCRLSWKILEEHGH